MPILQAINPINYLLSFICNNKWDPTPWPYNMDIDMDYKPGQGKHMVGYRTTQRQKF